MRHRGSPPGGRNAQCGPLASDAQRRGGRRGPATTPDFKVDGPVKVSPGKAGGFNCEPLKAACGRGRYAAT